MLEKSKPLTLINSPSNGGQTAQICIVGEIDEWKKPQKKPKKNIISDIINNIKPILNPFRTKFVWKSGSTVGLPAYKNIPFQKLKKLILEVAPSEIAFELHKKKIPKNKSKGAIQNKWIWH